VQEFSLEFLMEPLGCFQKIVAMAAGVIEELQHFDLPGPFEAVGFAHQLVPALDSGHFIQFDLRGMTLFGEPAGGD